MDWVRHELEKEILEEKEERRGEGRRREERGGEGRRGEEGEEMKEEGRREE